MSAAFEEYRLLFAVFRLGLVNGIISLTTVKAWADDTIITTDEPAYIIIELAMVRDVNEALAILNAELGSNYGAVAIRAMIGIAGHKLKDGVLQPLRIANLLYNLNDSALLTKYEFHEIYAIDDDFLGWDEDDTDSGPIKGLVNFLDHYREFNLSNFAAWPVLSLELEGRFNRLYEEQCITGEAYIKAVRRTKFWKRLVKTSLLFVLIILSFFGFIYLLITYPGSTLGVSSLPGLLVCVAIPLIRFTFIMIDQIWKRN